MDEESLRMFRGAHMRAVPLHIVKHRSDRSLSGSGRLRRLRCGWSAGHTWLGEITVLLKASRSCFNTAAYDGRAKQHSVQAFL